MPKISIFVFLLELQIGSETVINQLPLDFIGGADNLSTLFGENTINV